MDKKVKKDQKSCCCKTKKIVFQVSAASATTVILTGDFNAWSKEGLKMKKEKTGIWKNEVELAPGRYEYKFIVDGKWWTDPSNKRTAINSFGDVNSVIEVSA
jgi:1,4-alpha-glucan branching enzyme